MIRYWLHKKRGHKVTIPGAGYRDFYRCWTCARGWGHKCTDWCGWCGRGHS